MKYQLVIQWPAFTITDYDEMIEVEDLLIQELTDANDVDGHDAGMDEVNIFIHTNDPQATFDELTAILCGSKYWTGVRMAYRELTKADYTILWPKNLDRFEVL